MGLPCHSVISSILAASARVRVTSCPISPRSLSTSTMGSADSPTALNVLSWISVMVIISTEGIRNKMANPPQSRSRSSTSLYADVRSLRIIPQLTSCKVNKHVFKRGSPGDGRNQFLRLTFHYQRPCIYDGNSAAELLGFVEVM